MFNEIIVIHNLQFIIPLKPKKSYFILPKGVKIAQANY